MSEESKKVDSIISSLKSSPNTSERPTPQSPSESQFLQYGDIIQIFTASEIEAKQTVKANLNQETFFVDYVDEHKIRIVNTVNFDTILLHIGDDGQLLEPSIRRIELLTRANEPGFARQKGLLPDQWVDIFFIGIEQPLTGKITHLEEDQIEVTLHPSKDIIYIDFSYHGIPEDYPIEKFVLRSAPPSSTKKPSPDEIDQEGDEYVQQDDEMASVTVASIEYTPENEAIIRLPETVEYDKSIHESLEEEYLDANSIFFGKDQEIVEQFLEQTQYETVYSIDTQLTSLMNELLSQIPNAERTHEVMLDVHRLLERFKELREQFSNMDSYTHQVQGYRIHGIQYKPLVDYLTHQPSVPLSWLQPVTEARRNMYVLPDEDASVFSAATDEEPPENVGDVVVSNVDVESLRDLQKMYQDNVMRGTTNPYRMFLEDMDTFFRPMVNARLTTGGDVLYPRKPVLFQQSVGSDTWEALVDNSVDFGVDFTATVSEPTPKYTKLKTARFFNQRYNDGTFFLERSPDQRRLFVPRSMTSSDTLSISSWVVLPSAIAQYSKTRLPTTDIMRRTVMSASPWMKYRTFPSNRPRFNIDVFTIEDFHTNYFSTGKQKTPGKSNNVANFMKGMQHMVLDRNLMRDNERFSEELYTSYLSAMLPSTFDLIELVQNHMTPYEGVCVKEFLDVLEPFMVYMNSLTYTQFNRMRYFIGQRVSQYKKQFHERKDQYLRLDNAYERLNRHGNVVDVVHRVLENGALHNIFMDVYQIRGLVSDIGGATPYRPISNAEVLQSILMKDGGMLFSTLLRRETLHHVVADSFLKAVEDFVDEDARHEDETPKLGSTKSPGCNRHFLVKRYTSLEALQKDNYQEEVYYDKEFDDTPYSILDAYKKDMPEKVDIRSDDMRDFLDLLSVNLVKKHQCPKSAAAELAITLVEKKKRVRDGEYAILDITSPGTTEGGETSAAIPDREFFKRIKNKWVRDSTVNEETFADLGYLVFAAFPNKRGSMGSVNRMICQSSLGCVKNPQTATCDPFASAEDRIRNMRQSFAVKEMEKRLNMSQEELEKMLEKEILDDSRRLAAMDRLATVQNQKYILNAYQMGKHAVEDAKPVIVSPYLALRDDILRQDDFTKKQYDLVRFFQSGFLRRAMVEELGEDDHWFYCTQTNTKLLPVFFYELALEYTTKGEEAYQNRLEKLKQFQMMSDDGDAIVDKHSGFVISKIEWVNEELYDEHGFKIQTGSALVIEPEDDQEVQQSTSMVFDVLDPQRSKVNNLGTGADADAADTEKTQMVKNIFFTFCRVMDITPKEYDKGGMREFVLRVSMELIDQSIKSKDDFIREMVKKSSSASVADLSAQYKKYYHQYVVIITTAVFLIGVQTSIPAIHTKKTVPGCVKSFTGYPLTESTEDQSGIQYLTCVLNLIKSSIAPWNAIKNISRDLIQQKIREKVSDILDTRKDIYELYLKQREYRDAHPEEFMIPEELQLQRWTGLLPPMVDIGVIQRLPVERHEASVKTPHSDVNIQQAASKVIHYGYGVIESIHKVVEQKDVILKTALGIPFIQNACCDEKTRQEWKELGKITTTMDYFTHEHPSLQNLLGHIQYYQSVLDGYRGRAKANTYVYTTDTRLVRPEVTMGNLEEVIYAAFIHYCQFDRIDAAIPAHLQSVCSSKPPEEKYRRNGTIKEKIQDLKHLGKTYSVEDFDNLIRRVNLANRVVSDIHFNPPSAIQILTDFLASDRTNVGDATTVPVNRVIDPIRSLLLDILVKYDPQIMLLESPPAGERQGMHEALDALMNVLGPANEAMKDRIVKFVKKGRNRDTVEKVLSELTQWSGGNRAIPGDEIYEMGQFIQNSIVFMIKLLPQMIFNNQFVKEFKVPNHWELGDKHKEVIIGFLQRNRDLFAKFSNNQGGFYRILQEVQGRLFDVVRLIQLIPVQLPIQQGNLVYFRLFDRETLHLLISYLWLSVFDQFLDVCRELPKNTVGTNQLKQTVEEYILALMDLFREDKDMVNQSYDTFMARVLAAREREKGQIMLEFQNANKSDRRFMYMEKVNKLGRWNVQSKDVFKYNDKQFEKELAEFVDDVVEDDLHVEEPEDPFEMYEGYEEDEDQDNEMDDYEEFNYDGDEYDE